MNLNQFLMKIFMLFPPECGENTANLLAVYLEDMATTVKYDYERAGRDFAKSYKYRKLPPIATLTEFLKDYRIKDTTQPDYREVIAWAKGNKYAFAYNANSESYTEVKYRLQQKGLIVNDSENEVKNV